MESDEWAAALLAKFLRDGDYEVALAADARTGFDQIRAFQPDCILCVVNLPDIDGFWVARRVRAEPPPVGTTPFLLLTEPDDREGRLQGLHVGADLFVNKPFAADELVAQVSALIAMAGRLRASTTAPSLPPPSSPEPLAFEGDIGQMSISTVLSVLELERRTGRLKVKPRAGSVAALDVVDGAFAGASLGGRVYTPTALLRELLGWKHGKFEFRSSSAPLAPAGTRHSMSELLLDAMRQEDEGRRR